MPRLGVLPALAYGAATGSGLPALVNRPSFAVSFACGCRCGEHVAAD